MKPDIATEDDLRGLVEDFYGTLARDPLVGPFFAGLDLDAHLPRIRAFWGMVLLDRPGYTTNVTEVHRALAQRMPLEPRHFDRWLELWRDAVDARFTGPVAETAKERALSIAAVIRAKVHGR